MMKVDLWGPVGFMTIGFEYTRVAMAAVRAVLDAAAGRTLAGQDSFGDSGDSRRVASIGSLRWAPAVSTSSTNASCTMTLVLTQQQQKKN